MPKTEHQASLAPGAGSDPGVPKRQATAVLDDEGPLVQPETVLSGRYRVIRQLGAGGMGEVHLAEHIEIEKLVAIKVLGRTLATRKDLVERFIREAKSSSKVRHPNVVDITDFGHTPDGIPYFVMEYLEGEGLAQILHRERPLPWVRARRLTIQICRALHAAHEKGIFHRDVKPDNCFVTRHGASTDFVKVLDFGIAKVADPDAQNGGSLTQTGVVMGTAAYMSPEQAQSLDVDARSDVYSVGVMLYEMLTGSVPFQGQGYLGVLTKHVTTPPPPFADVAPNVQLPPELEALVLRALAKNPDERYATAAEFAQAVETFYDPALMGASGSGSVPGSYVGMSAADHSSVAYTSAPGTPPPGAATPAPMMATPAPVASTTDFGGSSEGGGNKILLGLGAGIALLGIGGFFALSMGDSEPAANPAVVSTETPQAAPAPAVPAPAPAPTPAEPVAEPPAAEEPGEGPKGAAAPDEAQPEAAPAEDEAEPAAKPRPRRTRRKKASGPRTRADMARALGRVSVSHCQSQGGMPGMSVRASVTFDPTGAVSKVSVHKPFTGSKLGRCIAAAAKKAKTGKGEGTETTTHTFKL